MTTPASSSSEPASAACRPPRRWPAAPFDVTVIDQHNYHLFQPLLYQVATAGLSPADIASPIRGILRRAQNINVMLGKVSGVDTARREVLAEGRRIPYDT